MSISFIMEMGDLDSENRKVLSGPPSSLQLSFQFVSELFTVYYHMHRRKINYTTTTTTTMHF